MLYNDVKKITAIAIALLIGCFLWMIISSDVKINTPLLSPHAPSVTVILPSGMGVYYLVSQLKKRGLIKDPMVMTGYLLFRTLRHSLKAGEYPLYYPMTIRDFSNNLMASHIVQHYVRFPEGATFEHIQHRLAQQSGLRHRLNNVDSEDASVILGKHFGPYLEGQFLPGTYAYAVRDTDISVLDQAYKAMSL